MALTAVAGSKIYIGTKVALKQEVVLADFADQDGEWLEIKGWTNSGTLGDTQNTIAQDFIGENRTNTIKGTRVAATMENTLSRIPNDPGQARLDAAIDDCGNYAFKVEWGAGCASEGVVTVTVAEPGVFTWAGGHGLEAGAAVMFTPDTGGLPSGISEDTAYYVVDDANLTATTFTVAATPGGAAIEITGAGTATEITATAQPVGSTRLFHGLAMPGTDQGGAANTALLENFTIMPNSNILKI